MQWPMTGAVILLAFLGATLAADACSARWRFAPTLLLGLGRGALFMEWTRFSHGHTDTLFWVGWIAAPLVSIFGGAAWGVRRFYGWPDLGVHPPRAAAVAACILVGVLAGSRLHAKDVEESQQRLDALLAAQTPEATICATASLMGRWSPPPYEKRVDAQGQAWWAFPTGADSWLARPPGEVRWRRFDGSQLLAAPEVP